MAVSSRDSLAGVTFAGWLKDNGFIMIVHYFLHECSFCFSMVGNVAQAVRIKANGGVAWDRISLRTSRVRRAQ